MIFLLLVITLRSISLIIEVTCLISMYDKICIYLTFHFCKQGWECFGVLIVSNCWLPFGILSIPFLLSLFEFLFFCVNLSSKFFFRVFYLQTISLIICSRISSISNLLWQLLPNCWLSLCIVDDFEEGLVFSSSWLDYLHSCFFLLTASNFLLLLGALWFRCSWFRHRYIFVVCHFLFSTVISQTDCTRDMKTFASEGRYATWLILLFSFGSLYNNVDVYIYVWIN